MNQSVTIVKPSLVPTIAPVTYPRTSHSHARHPYPRPHGHAPSFTVPWRWTCQRRVQYLVAGWVQLIGFFQEKLQENPMIFMGKSGWFPVKIFSQVNPLIDGYNPEKSESLGKCLNFSQPNLREIISIRYVLFKWFFKTNPQDLGHLPKPEK